MDDDDMSYLVTGTGKTVEEAMECFMDGYKDTKAYYAEVGKPFQEAIFVFKKEPEEEVDLEKEIHNAADQYDINNNGNIYWEDIVGFAKHFFELGLKAQKGE